MNIEITNKHRTDAVALIRGVRLGMINSNNKDLKLYGIVSTQMKIEPVDYLSTCATDGEKLYINPLFILGLSKEELQTCVSKMQQSPFYSKKQEDDFILMFSRKSVKFLEFCISHELDHCCYDHFTRVGTRDKSLYNQAADYRINADQTTKLWGGIAAAKTKEPIFNLLCLDEKYKEKLWDSYKIYDDLVSKQQQNKQNQNGNGESQGQPLDDHMYSDNTSGSGKETDFDKFVKDVLGLPDSPKGVGKDSGDNVSTSNQMNNNRIKEAFIQTAKEIGYGNGGIIDQIKTLQEPVINWKKQLRKNLNGLNKTETDPKKLHRRIHGLSIFMKQHDLLDPKLGLYKAGKKPEEIVNVYVLADMSGSIGNKERITILSECHGICSQYKQFQLTVASWDTCVYEKDIQVYTKKNKNDLKNHKFVGGGGTDANCIATYLDKIKLKKYDKILIMTDMYFGNPDKLKPYSNHIIWLSTSKNMDHAARGMGKYIEYDRYI